MRESGNILFLILIAVALFAALSYAVTGSSRSGVDSISKDKAKIAAAEIVQYGTQLEQAMTKMKLINGCKDEQFSFERSPFDGSDTDYLNPNAPADKRCHLFHPNGGNVHYLDIDEDVLDAANNAELRFGELYFPQNTCIRYYGTGGTDCYTDADGTDLILALPFLKMEVCSAINDLVQIKNKPDGRPPQEWNRAWQNWVSFFKGTYGAQQNVDYDTQIVSKPRLSGCFEGNLVPVAGTFHFYQGILPR